MTNTVISNTKMRGNELHCDWLLIYVAMARRRRRRRHLEMVGHFWNL